MRSAQEIGRATLTALERLRRRRGLSQSQLGAISGMGQGDVSQTLRGRYPDWRLTTVFRLATALEADLDVFVTPREDRQVLL